MKEKLQELRDLIAIKHGIKLNDKSVTLIVFEMLEFFSNSLMTKIETTKEKEDARYEEFLIKWEKQGKELAEKALNASLNATIENTKEQMQTTINNFQEIIDNKSKELSSYLSKSKFSQDNDWKFLGFSKKDIIPAFFTSFGLLAGIFFCYLRSLF